MSLRAVIEAMLVPGRTFSVRGLCKMHGVPDVEEPLKAMRWIIPNDQGWSWRGPRPQTEEQMQKLVQDVIGFVQDGLPQPSETPAQRKGPGRPKKKPTPGNELSRIAFHLPDMERARIEAAAKADGRTMSAWIRRTLKQHLDALEEPERDAAAVSLGKKGGESRALALSPDRRSEIAKNAAKKRWWRIEDDLEEMKGSPEE